MTRPTTISSADKLYTVSPLAAEDVPATALSDTPTVVSDRCERSWMAEIDGLVSAVIAAAVIGGVTWALIDANASLECRVAIRGTHG